MCIVTISHTSSGCVIVNTHVSVITQWGESSLMEAAKWGNTEVVGELVKAGTNMDMQTEVCQNLFVIHSHVRVYMYM